jgi:hypothetical protein
MSKKLLAVETDHYEFFIYEYEDGKEEEKVWLQFCRQLWEVNHIAISKGYTLDNVKVLFYNPGKEPKHPIGYVNSGSRYEWRYIDEFE